MEKISLSSVREGIRLYNLKKMLADNDTYDFLGNNIKEQIEAEVERLQKIYDEEKENN